MGFFSSIKLNGIELPTFLYLDPNYVRRDADGLLIVNPGQKLPDYLISADDEKDPARFSAALEDLLSEEVIFQIAASKALKKALNEINKGADSKATSEIDFIKGGKVVESVETHSDKPMPFLQKGVDMLASMQQNRVIQNRIQETEMIAKQAVKLIPETAILKKLDQMEQDRSLSGLQWIMQRPEMRGQANPNTPPQPR